MAGSPPPEESLIALARILVAEQSLDKTLRQVLELACDALPGGEGGIVPAGRRGNCRPDRRDHSARQPGYHGQWRAIGAAG